MYRTIDGLRIHYEQVGKGNNYAVILHGWGCCANTYAPIADILASAYNVLIPEMPGFGKSDEPPTGWDTTKYTEILIKFIRSFTTGTVAFIGHSFGVRLMIRMASRNELPFAISRMVFIDGAGLLSDRIDEYLQGYREFERKKVAFIQAGDNESLFRLRETSESDYAFLDDVMCSCYINVVTENLIDLLPSIKVPTLLIWGANDIDTPLEDGRTMERLIPDSGLVVLDDAGHYSFIDRPYAFRLIIESFLVHWEA